MSFTQTELDALKRAYATGVLEVEYDGKKTRYDSGEALLRRIKVIEAEMATLAGAPKSMTTLTSFNRG
jgi:hypothetical protein